MAIKSVGVARVGECMEGITVETAWQYYEEDPNGAIAYVYDEMCEVLVNSFKKYFWTDEEDRISSLMLSIDKALKTFDEEKSVSFKTYLTSCYRNLLINERNYLFAKTKGRDWFLDVIYYDTEKNSKGEDAKNERNNIENSKYIEDRFSIVEILDEKFVLSLTENQYKYLKIILESSVETLTDAEAARILGISRMGVAKIRKSVGKKLIENGIL